MSWFTGVLLYVMIWWVVLLAVLPWGNRPASRPEEGHAEGAPANPRLGLKALATTIIAAIVFAAVYIVVRYNLIVIWDMVPKGA